MHGKQRSIFKETGTIPFLLFIQDKVTISKANYIQLKRDAKLYKTAHSRSVKQEKIFKMTLRYTHPAPGYKINVAL